MRYKHFILSIKTILLIIAFVSCSSVQKKNAKTDITASVSGGAVIPFSYCKTYLPVFTVTDSSGIKLCLAFDSGFTYCALNKNGLKKATGSSKKLLENAIDYCKQQNPDIGDNLIKRNAAAMVKQGRMGITVYELHADKFSAGNTVFHYEPETAAYDSVDGIVGFSFFGDCKNITIDYLHSVIYIDSNTLSGTILPMEKEPIGLYATKITINGREQTALIDTGAQEFIVRRGYNTDIPELTGVQKQNFIYDGKQHVGVSLPVYKTVTVKYGGVERKVHAYRSDNILIHASVYGKRTGCVYNLFGWPFFKGRCIQFDFENKKFVIG